MDTTRPYILVVDDLPDAADSLAELIAHWGYDAEPLYSGAAALDAARTRRPAAVLLDLGMPRMNGFQAVTGHEALVLQAREVGIDYFLVKPVDLSLLRELLGRGSRHGEQLLALRGEAVLVDEAVERSAAHSERLGRLHLVPAVPPEYVRDVPLLHPVQVVGADNGR